MSTLGNILWFVFGGFFLGLAWMLFSLLAFITIIGIPWGRASFVIGKFAFFPFGKEAIDRSMLSANKDIGSGALGVIGNIIWFIFAGLSLGISHFILAICCFITIIGIPFGIQHLKLAGLAIFPIGKTIVTKEVATAARKRYAEQFVVNAQNRT